MVTPLNVSPTAQTSIALAGVFSIASELPIVPTSATGGGASPVGVVVETAGTGPAACGTAVPSGWRSGVFQIFSYAASGGSEFAVDGLVAEVVARKSTLSCFSSGQAKASNRLASAANARAAEPS